MRRTPETVEIVRRWFERAEGHIEAARVLIRAGNDQTADAACYHAHEAVATLIKAVLTMHGAVAPRIHDLEFLHRLIPEESRFPADPNQLAWLSTYGIERWWEPDSAQAEQALEYAVAIRDSIRNVLDTALFQPAV